MTFIMEGICSTSISKSGTIFPVIIFEMDLTKKKAEIAKREKHAIKGKTQSFASVPVPE